MKITVPNPTPSDDGQPIPFALTPAAELLAAVASSPDPAAAGRVVEAIRQARPDALPAGHVPTAHALQRTPCFSWCTEADDFGEPTAHESATAVLAATDGMDRFEPAQGSGNGLLAAVLYHDDNLRDPVPQVHLSHGSEGFDILSPDEAAEFADRLIGFAAQIRGMVRQAREVRPEFCRVFLWCRETGDHVTHMSRTLALAEPNTRDTYLGAYLMAEEAEGNRVEASFEGAGQWQDMAADQVRVEANRIRAHCGELEKLAGLLECEEINHRLGLRGGENR